MALKEISLYQAQIIVDIYIKLLLSERKPDTYIRFKFSDLEGYDFYDVDNSLKLLSAERIFKSKILTPDVIEKFKHDVQKDSLANTYLLHQFIPDDIADKLEGLSFTEQIILMPKVFEHHNTFDETETHESFLNFCLALKESNLDFWGRVYSRLGIDQYAVMEPTINKFTYKDFFLKNKDLITSLVYAGFLSLSLYNTLLRLVIFSGFIIFIIAIISLIITDKEEKRSNIKDDLRYLLLLVAGLCFWDLSKYVVYALLADILILYVNGLVKQKPAQ